MKATEKKKMHAKARRNGKAEERVGERKKYVFFRIYHLFILQLCKTVSEVCSRVDRQKNERRGKANKRTDGTTEYVPKRKRASTVNIINTYYYVLVLGLHRPNTLFAVVYLIWINSRSVWVVCGWFFVRSSMGIYCAFHGYIYNRTHHIDYAPSVVFSKWKICVCVGASKWELTPGTLFDVVHMQTAKC